jgi:hypothetical protein
MRANNGIIFENDNWPSRFCDGYADPGSVLATAEDSLLLPSAGVLPPEWNLLKV